jgi:hypothetical protein
MRKIIFLTMVTGLLTGALNSVAQPRLSADRQVHSFGLVEWKHPAVATFTITNTGTSSLVLTDVTASCSCTNVVWTQTAIAAGQTGQVSVTFDAETLGTFTKNVTLYSNAEPYYSRLQLTGRVVDSETFAREASTQARNASSAVNTPVAPPVSAATLAIAPRIDLSVYKINLKPLSAGVGSETRDVIIANKGVNPLRIAQIEVSDPRISVSLKKREVKAGGYTRLRLVIGRTGTILAPSTLSVVVHSNDPVTPLAEIVLVQP